MLRLALLLLCSPVPAVAALEPVHAVAAQDPKPDKRPEVKELVGKLSDHVKKKGDEDADAVAVIDELLKEFEKSGPKDRTAIVKGLEKVFKAKRKQSDTGEYDNKLYLASATAMAHMGPESVKPLLKQIGAKAHKKNLALQRRLILSVGKTKDKSASKTLISLLKHHEPTLMGAAAEAMGEFEGADVKLRKEFFSEMLKLLIGTKTQMDNDPQDNITRDIYNVISGPIVTSMTRLTGHEIREPEEWQRFWNKNKKKDWDDPEFAP